MPGTIEPQDFLLRPRFSFEILAGSDSNLRATFVRFQVGPKPTKQTKRFPRPTEILMRSAKLLELFVAVSGFVEAADDLGVLDASQADHETFGKIRERAQTLSGFDPVSIVAANLDLVREQLSEATPPPSGTDFMKPALLRGGVRSFLEICPISKLLDLGETFGQEELGFRCRRAYDALEGFMRRHDPSIKNLDRIVGSAYSAGGATAQEAAATLGLSVSDCVAFLESHGYGRSPEVIRLSDEGRGRLLGNIRKARRRGPRKPSRDWVKRDVIASQRIESVDARPYL